MSLGAPPWMGSFPLISHRGEECTTHAPENSHAAFETAVAKGLPIELDVVISKDNVAMVFHDQSLIRLTGQRGKIAEMLAADIQAATLKNGEGILTLQQALDAVGGRVPVLIDLKPQLGVSGKTAAKVVSEVISSCPYSLDQLATQSFSPTYLRKMRTLQPHLRRGQLSYFVEDLLFLPWSRPDFVVTNFRSMRFMLGLRRGLGIELVGWGVKPEDFQKATQHFKAVIADFENHDPLQSLTELREAFASAKEALAQAHNNPQKLWNARKHLICSPVFEQLVPQVEDLCRQLSHLPAETITSLSSRMLNDLEALEERLFGPACDWVTSCGETVGRLARKIWNYRQRRPEDYPRSETGLNANVSPPPGPASF